MSVDWIFQSLYNNLSVEVRTALFFFLYNSIHQMTDHCSSEYSEKDFLHSYLYSRQTDHHITKGQKNLVHSSHLSLMKYLSLYFQETWFENSQEMYAF